MPIRLAVPGLLVGLSFFIGQGTSAQPTLLQAHASGEQVYKAVCSACHETGVAQAPKLGDRAAWKPLIEEGQHILTAHAWVGVRAMPSRGGSTDLSLADFSRAVAFMGRASGADWKDPESKLLLAIVKEADKRLSTSIKEQQAMQRELHRIAKAVK
jgi:cytochrome c5